MTIIQDDVLSSKNFTNQSGSIIPSNKLNSLCASRSINEFENNQPSILHKTIGGGGVNISNVNKQSMRSQPR